MPESLTYGKPDVLPASYQTNGKKRKARNKLAKQSRRRNRK